MKKTIFLFLFCHIYTSAQPGTDLFAISKLPLLFPNPAKKCFISVYLKNGNALQDTGSIVTGLFYGNEYIKIGNTKILPSETDSIKINSILGLPSKGSWFWRAVEGKLNLFTYHPNKNINNYAYIQKEGNLVRYSPKTLELFVSDYPEAKKLVSDFRLEQTVAASMLFGGIMIMGSGLIVNPKYRVIPIATGALSISFATVLFIKSNHNCKKAIKIYNNR